MRLHTSLSKGPLISLVDLHVAWGFILYFFLSVWEAFFIRRGLYLLRTEERPGTRNKTPATDSTSDHPVPQRTQSSSGSAKASGEGILEAKCPFSRCFLRRVGSRNFHRGNYRSFITNKNIQFGGGGEEKKAVPPSLQAKPLIFQAVKKKI